MVFLQHYKAFQAWGLATCTVYAVDHMASLLLFHKQDIEDLKKNRVDEYQTPCETSRRKEKNDIHTYIILISNIH